MARRNLKHFAELRLNWITLILWPKKQRPSIASQVANGPPSLKLSKITLGFQTTWLYSLEADTAMGLFMQGLYWNQYQEVDLGRGRGGATTQA